MSLKCVLGLVACLSYGGTSVPAQDAVDAMDSCSMVKTTALKDSMLQTVAESIEARIGKRIEWPAKAPTGVKRQAILRECASFSRYFNNEKAWSNLEKWPF